MESISTRATHFGERQRRSGWAWADAAIDPPDTADAFAEAVILAICSASVTPEAGRRAFQRCRLALLSGANARLGFRHPAKAEAVDRVWRERHRFFREYRASSDKLAFLATLPWIGPVTRRTAARALGLIAAGETRAETL